MPIRLAIAAPSARPAARATASARLVAGAAAAAASSAMVVGRRGPRRAASRRIAGALATVSRQPKRPQWHSRAVGLDDDVADLAGAVAVAAEQLAVEDEAGADAAPDLDRDEVARPLVATEQVGREGRGAAVVGDDRREAVAVLRGAGRAGGRSRRG